MPQAIMRTWVGPLVLLIGALVIAGYALQPTDERSSLGWWMLANSMAFERNLPLLGFAVGLALVSERAGLIALLLFVAGIPLGQANAPAFLEQMDALPGAERYVDLSSALLSVLIGMALILPQNLRGPALGLVAPVAGAMFAISVWVNLPGYDENWLSSSGYAFGVWLIAGAGLTLRALRRDWFEIPARILGSWLIAIGLLYGGASFVPKRPVGPVAPAAPGDAATGAMPAPAFKPPREP